MLPPDPGGAGLGLVGFFSRRRADFLTRPPEYIPAEAPNIDELAFLPVSAGLWRQHELWDGTYTLGDLLDAAELIALHAENRRRSAGV